MQQPTPGHRRRRDKTVTVAELMHRERTDDETAAETTGPMQTDWFEADPPEQSRFTEETYPAARIPLYRDPPDDAENAEDAGETRDATNATERTGPQHALPVDHDPFEPESDAHPQHLVGRESSTLAKAGRVVALTVGLLVLGGAVTTAWSLHRHQEPPRADAAPLEITGIAALRPDAVAARLGGAATGFTADAPRTGGTETPATDAPDDATTPQSAVGVVERFYDLASRTPAKAAELIDPKLLGTQGSQLLSSWRKVRAIRVEQVDEVDADVVQAVVRTQNTDGRWLRMRQEVHTTDAELPQIDTVRVLSAQYG